MTIEIKATHTPGPWVEWDELRHVEYVGNIEIGQRTGGRIATVWRTPREDAEANARLIAAAPDLLAALEALRHDYHVLRRHVAKSRDEGRCNEEFCGETNAAIAKARGEPS